MTQTTTKPQVQGRILIENVRVAFAHGLFTASAPPNSNGQPAYSAQFVFPPTHKSVGALQKLIQEAGVRQWKDQAAATLKAAAANGKLCLRNGDDKSNYEGYAGNLYLSARTKTRPTIIDQNKQPITEESGLLFSGCWVNVMVDIFPYIKGSKGVGAGLKVVQLVKPDTAWGGGAPVDVDSEFGTVEQSAEASSEFGDLFGIK